VGLNVFFSYAGYLGVKFIGLIAVGTGITPIWQIIKEIFRRKSGKFPNL
jgi:NAD(P)H-flavin reductase